MRSLGMAIAALGLSFLSCAQNAHFASPVALDFFVESPREDPWNAKIRNWQSRNQLDQQTAAQRPVGSELSAGVQLFGGNGQSGEFGSLPTLWILRADVFF